MKRLLLAAGLAVGLHGLLFSMEAEWTKKKAIYRLRPEPVAFTLNYKKPKVQALPPAKKPFESKKTLIPVKKKSQRKKARARPAKKVRITQKKREAATKPEENLLSKIQQKSLSHVEPAPVSEHQYTRSRSCLSKKSFSQIPQGSQKKRLSGHGYYGSTCQSRRQG